MSESGGQVEFRLDPAFRWCRRSGFFISGSGEFVGDSVRMAIVENGPEWFLFTNKLRSIEETVELIRSLD